MILSAMVLVNQSAAQRLGFTARQCIWDDCHVAVAFLAFRTTDARNRNTNTASRLTGTPATFGC